MGPQVIDKNQPIRLAEFCARTQKYSNVPARTIYFKDPDVVRDTLNYFFLTTAPFLKHN